MDNKQITKDFNEAFSTFRKLLEKVEDKHVKDEKDRDMFSLGFNGFLAVFFIDLYRKNAISQLEYLRNLVEKIQDSDKEEFGDFKEMLQEDVN